jgi:isopenicillin N synthase-like dioxygenase
MSDEVLFPCTCQEPPAVNLSSHDCHDKLLQNLQQFGWSPIVTELSTPPPSHEEIVEFFKTNTKDPHSYESMMYRSAESGGTEEIEPKESLELSLCNAAKEESKIGTWCLALSQIAHDVCKLLDIPANTLLAGTAEESLDLLRVFYYHATHIPKLGSSPHTDWGSWTIVWQDSVGGLETYCRACQKWVGVQAPPVDTKAWQCIVHVGDMASLALENVSKRTCNSVQWPSPRHQVVNSELERTSLVYFGYPPAEASIQDMQKSLAGWKVKNRGRRLPLEEYYLLHDQSSSVGRATKEAATKSPESMLRFIESVSVQGVIQEKWYQVQRGSD